MYNQESGVEITVKQSIARRSRVIIALVDSTKWDNISYGTFVGTGQIHTIISDQNTPENMAPKLKREGLKLFKYPHTLRITDEPTGIN